MRTLLIATIATLLSVLAVPAFAGSSCTPNIITGGYDCTYDSGTRVSCTPNIITGGWDCR